MLAVIVTEYTADSVARPVIVLVDPITGRTGRTVVPRLPSGWRADEILRWEGEDALAVTARGPMGEHALHVLDLADGGSRASWTDQSGQVDWVVPGRLG